MYKPHLSSERVSTPLTGNDRRITGETGRCRGSSASTRAPRSTVSQPPFFGWTNATRSLKLLTCPDWFCLGCVNVSFVTENSSIQFKAESSPKNMRICRFLFTQFLHYSEINKIDYNSRFLLAEVMRWTEIFILHRNRQFLSFSEFFLCFLFRNG